MVVSEAAASRSALSRRTTADRCCKPYRKTAKAVLRVVGRNGDGSVDPSYGVISLETR
jgi:hypothetical protein